MTRPVGMKPPSVTIAGLVLERLQFASFLRDCVGPTELAVGTIAEAFKDGHRLFIFGNGGSAADAQHMAAEFIGRFGKDRIGLPAIALTTDTSALTAIANDWEYSYVFKRQLEALARPGDVALGISTSGNSRNVLEALAHARSNGIVALGIVGNGGGMMADICSIMIDVGRGRTPIVQERQLAIEHIICEMVEGRLRDLGFL